ncbi:hypothetical protein ACUN7V_18185 [Quadrisphaera oryzae]|uniref:hypothetical protein n=1 Tax=Quadrisphaera TaxID=317661 RepID=UPI00164639AC|nr:hypothetical protein [Quadrisphaera sp. RL12-1S]MBC3761442.1 hypothetical protein [Quadrisphaera sp. RL12-1S]
MSSHLRGDADDGESALALAVRRAVEDDDGAWSSEHLSAVAERAAGRAARRRRRRLVVAPAAVLAVAVAVAAGVAVVPSLVAAERAAPVAASRPPTPAPSAADLQPADPAMTAAAEAAGRLSTAEVQWVLPGARAQVQFRGRPGWVTEPDACGTADLDVVAPEAEARGTWSLQTPGASADQGSTDRVAPWLTSRVATYADPAQAKAYVRALDASTRTCVPAEGEPRPSSPQVFQVRLADALYGSTTASAPGQYRLTAAVAAGAHVAVISALVDLTEGGEQATAEQLLASDVAQLATAAAARADGRAGAQAPLDLARSPVTTADVGAVLPGARPVAAYTAGLALDGQLRDACGRTPLAGVAAPGRLQRWAWLDPELGHVDFGVGGSGPSAAGNAALVVVRSDFATEEEARAYATAFERSATTCGRGTGAAEPVPLRLSPVGTPDALLTTGYAPSVQRYGYDAVVVRGSTAATVLASVPGDATDASAEQAVHRVIDLATAAADRAAADAASGS